MNFRYLFSCNAIGSSTSICERIFQNNLPTSKMTMFYSWRSGVVSADFEISPNAIQQDIQNKP